MRNRHLGPYLERVIGAAAGRVLEIGAGSGLNLARHPLAVRELVALEPDPKPIGTARLKAAKRERPLSFLEASAESIPLEDHSIDTVVSTWTMCNDCRATLTAYRLVGMLLMGAMLRLIQLLTPARQSIRPHSQAHKALLFALGATHVQGRRYEYAKTVAKSLDTIARHDCSTRRQRCGRSNKLPSYRFGHVKIWVFWLYDGPQ